MLTTTTVVYHRNVYVSIIIQFLKFLGILKGAFFKKPLLYKIKTFKSNLYPVGEAQGKAVGIEVRGVGDRKADRRGEAVGVVFEFDNGY